MGSMTSPELQAAKRRAREDAADAAARAETLRRDGARTLGENLEQADRLIRVAFELARGLAPRRA
jgi:hypothetical protein